MTVCVAPGEIVSFWGDAGPDKWFEQDETFDQAIRLRFLATYEAAKNSELRTWEDSVEGALALVLVLDQFPRNLFRGDARAFATMRWRAPLLSARWRAVLIKRPT